MSLNELLVELSEHSVKLWVEGEQLRLRAPKGILTQHLRDSLNKYKAELLALLSQQNRVTGTSSISIPLVPRDKDIPLSFAQEGLWFIDQLEGKSSTYNISAARKVTGSLNLTALETSLAEIVRRHEILRTTFKMVNGFPVQVINSSLTVPLSVVDLQSLAESDQSLEVQRSANEEAQQPFDLATGPLVRFKLLRLASESHVLLLTIHHIISDVWSMGIIIRELTTLYTGFLSENPSPLPELPIQYADYTHWQRQWLTNEVLETQLNYWKQQLAGAPSLLALPTDQPRPPVQTFRGAIEYFHLKLDLTQQLKRLSQQAGATLYMTLLTAFMTLLSYYSGQKDIVVGSSIANRNPSELTSLIGFFVNTLVLRGDLSGNPTFRELLERIRKVTLDAFAHQDLPFEKLVEKLRPERNQSYNPLFQVYFVLQNAPLVNLELPGITLSPVTLEKNTAMFDLTLSIEETKEGLQGFWEYNTDLFDNDTIKRMIQRFQSLLKNIADNPNTAFSELQFEPKVEMPALYSITETDTKIPLSYHQERLWFIDQFETGNVYKSSPTYHNIPLILHLKGSVDSNAIEDSINEVINRHGALRTRIVCENNQGFQVISPYERLTLKVVNLAKDGQEVTIDSVIKQALDEARHPFLLERDLLTRATFFKMSAAESLLVITVHHIVADKRSLALIMQELAEIYRARTTERLAQLAKLTLQYADYTQWQHNLPKSVLEPLYFYWKQQLTGKLQVLELPSNLPRPAIHTFTDARHTFLLNKQLTQQLKIFSQRESCDEFVILLTAFKVLLYCYTRQEEIVVGTSEICRNQSGIKEVVGPFANLVVLRSYLAGNFTLRVLLAQVSKTVNQAKQHQEMPFDKLVLELNPEKDMSRTALFDVLFQFQEKQPLTLNMGEVEARAIDTNIGYGKYDINLSLQPIGNELLGTVVYNADIYEPFLIEQMLRHFEVIVGTIVANPQQRLDDITLLNQAEEHQQLVSWNTTQASYPQDQTIHQLFEEQANKTPDKIAVVCGTEHLTYHQLDAQANQLAHYLKQQGVVPETLVALCLDRSLEMIVALLGVLKAGGAYLPVDPTYPEERIYFVVEDAQVSHIITTQALANRLPKQVPSLILLDAHRESITAQPTTTLTHDTSPENLAYCIYTSGSTGKPKGALLEHRNVIRLLVNDSLQFTFGTDDVWTMFHSYCFDFSVWEMYGALLYGGKLVIVPSQVTKDPLSFLEVLIREKVTVLNQTPTFFYSLMQETLQQPKVDFALRYIIFGGEALHPIQLKAWNQVYPEVKLINMYGITETTVHVSFKEITEREIQANISNIGVPIPTTTSYIMDSQLRLLPVGVAGEICVGGDGVSRGYLNRDELTAQRFVRNPYKPQERMYRSGDLAKLLPNGEMVHLGRMDHQVKIRGFRVELGEIQNHLLKHSAVNEAIVVTRKVGSDELKIVAYIVPAISISVAELRNYVAQTLPYFMVPSVFVMLEKMPITSNGKVDHRALPAPEISNLTKEASFVPPRDLLEMQLVQIWEEILQLHPVGVRDNFFDLGGHSLLAVRLMAQIQEKFARNLPLSTLFQGATIEELAGILREQTENQAWSPLVKIQTKGSKLPFFCVHPVGGNVLCYVDLAHHLGADRPFYGLQARGMIGEHEPRICIEDMATDYLEALRAIQPQGPYYLGGWSFGGLVAFEMAQQLQSSGQQVALLALIDTRAPIADLRQVHIDDAIIATLLAKDLGGSFGKELPISDNELRQLEPDAQLSYILKQAKMAGIILPNTELEQIRQILQVYRANIQASLNYVPQVYPNPITLLRAEESLSQAFEFLLTKFPEMNQDGVLGWSQFSAQPIKVQTISGNHYSILSAPKVQDLAGKLKSYLFG